MERELLGFAEARAYLLEALAVELGWTFSATQREYDSNQELRRRIDTAALNVSCPESRSIHPPSIETEHRIASRRGPHPTNPPTSHWHAPVALPKWRRPTMTSDTNSNSEETAVATELGRELINRLPTLT